MKDLIVEKQIVNNQDDLEIIKNNQWKQSELRSQFIIYCDKIKKDR